MFRGIHVATLVGAVCLASTSQAQTNPPHARSISIDLQAQGQAEQFLTAHGYQKPLVLFTDANCWAGTALRDSAVVYIELLRDGTIIER